MANRHKAQKKNIGGAVAYNAANSEVIKAAKKKAGGGKVLGDKSTMRLDRGSRGPFSSAKC